MVFGFSLNPKYNLIILSIKLFVFYYFIFVEYEVC